MSSETRFRAPRGMRDVLPEEIPAWERLEEVAERLSRLRGFREIRPPVVEETDLFTRSVGEVTDIVEKEMFTLVKGEHSFTLRPEGTAGVMRAYLQAGYDKRAPVQKLYYTGPMFRYERPQKGRERQFTQFDVECLGSLDPRLDAEVIRLAVSFFEELGVTGLEVRLNSMGDGADRDAYREAVTAYLREHFDGLSELSRARLERNVLRVLDSKDPGDIAIVAGAPKLIDFLSDENREHFETVLACLEQLGCKAVVDSGIVRGMDYYTRTVFEVHAPSLGARSAVCGGGRYDHLMKELGGPDLGAVGFAVGFSATLLVLKELGLLEELEEEVPDVFVVGADPSCDRDVLVLAEELRSAGISALYDCEGRSLKSQMKVAGRGKHRAAVILGPDELERGVCQLKDLGRSEQREVSRADLRAELERLLGST